MYYRVSDRKIANTAPCGSAITLILPTPAMLIGGKISRPPLASTLPATASQSSTEK